MFFDTVIKELIMDIIIFRIILILISVGLLYTTYQSYLREKYSGKKFVWSAKDIRNKKKYFESKKEHEKEIDA